MVSPSSKKTLVAILVVCFSVQTALVYSDHREEPLSPSALRGRKIFHEQACQVCHQLWGQGGFLGPDLTNAASRVDSVRLRSLLTVGSGQMPALGLSDARIADVAAFLREIDRPDLGRGQLRLGSADEGAGPQALFARVIRDALPAGSPQAAGFDAWESRSCTQCHVPFETSVVGAPDLSGVTERLSLDELATVLGGGRPERGMPPPAPPFSERERKDVVAWLRWLGANRATLRDRMTALGRTREVDWSGLPWWEFR